MKRVIFSGLFKRGLIYFLIFNHLITFQLAAVKFPPGHTLHDGEFVDHFHVPPHFGSIHKKFIQTHTNEIKTDSIRLRKGTSGSYRLSIDHDIFKSKLNLFLTDETQDDEIIGHIVSNEKMVSFIGAKGCNFEVGNSLNLRSLDVHMGGNLHFLKDVKIDENASLKSNALLFGGTFQTSGSLELDVQENIVNKASLESGKNIIAKFKELKTQSIIKSLGDIVFKGKKVSIPSKTSIESSKNIYFDIESEISNNGFVSSEGSLILNSKTLINREKLSSKDLVIKIKENLNNLGSIFSSGNSQAQYKEFWNSGHIKIQGDFSSEGDFFLGQKGTCFPENLWVGGIYRANIKGNYNDSGRNYWDSFATIQAGKLELLGKYTSTSAMLNSKNAIIVGGEASFQTNHFIGLKAEGTVEFKGKVLLTPSAKKPMIAQGPAFQKLSNLIAKMPHTLSIEGKKGIWQNGHINSETTSISYSTDGNFQLKGKSSSGFFESNKTEITALNAILSGSLISYGDVLARVQENLDIAGKFTAHRLNAIAQSIQISGSLHAHNASLKGEENINISSSGSLRIENTLNLSSDGYINHEGKTHSKNILAQGTSITNKGDITASEASHFKADLYFANLWGGSISARDINIDASLNLNFLSTLNASRSLTINALFDLNLWGLESAHHISSSSLLSLNTGLCLPSPSLEDIFSWDTLMIGTKAATMAVAPPEVRALINLGSAAYRIYKQAPILYNRYQNLENPRVSDWIPLIVGMKDLVVSGYSAYSTLRDLNFDTPMPVFSIKSMEDFSANAAWAAFNAVLPSITQDSLINLNMGIMCSGNVYQRGIYSNNLGYIGAENYTNDTFFATNTGDIFGNNISFSNKNFLNKGNISAFGNANIKAEKVKTRVDSHIEGKNVSLKGEDVQHEGIARADNYLLIKGDNTTVLGKRSIATAMATDIGQERQEEGPRSKRVRVEEGAQIGGTSVFIRGEDVQHEGIARADNYLLIKGDNTTVLGKRSIATAMATDIGQERQEEGPRSKRVRVEEGAQIGGTSVFIRGEDVQHEGIARADNYLLIKGDNTTTLGKRSITTAFATDIGQDGYEEGGPRSKRVCVEEGAKLGGEVRVRGETIELNNINASHNNTFDMEMPVLSSLYVEGSRIKMLGESSVDKSLYVKGDIVEQLGTTNSGESSYIEATEQYIDTAESRNESGGTVTLIAPENNGFNGQQVAGGTVSYDLKDMNLQALLNQTNAPIIQASLREGNIVLDKNLNVSTVLLLQAQRFENNASFSANQDFTLQTAIETINKGNMVAEGGMELESQGLIDNHGLMEGTTFDAKAPIIINESNVKRVPINGGYADVIESQATMGARIGDLKVEATEELQGVGGHFEVPNGTADVTSQGTLYLGAKPLEQEFEYWKDDGHTLVDYHQYQQTHHLTQINAGGGVNLWSGEGGTTLHGVDINSTSGEINHKSAGELKETPVYNILQTDNTWQNGKKNGSEHTYTVTPISNHFKPGPGKDVRLEATKDNFHQAPHIESSGGAVFITSDEGKVYMLPAIAFSMTSSEKFSENLVWWSHKQKEQYDETVVMPTILGAAPGKVHISGAQGVELGIKNVGNNQAQFLDILEKETGTEWIKELRKDPNVTWHLINEEHEKWNHKDQGLTAPAAAVIGITLSIVTMGTGAALLALPAASIQGVMASAAFSSLASQASISLINNKGNIGEVFKEMGSKDSIRSLATSIASAGITHGLSSKLTFSQSTSNFTKHFQKSLVSSGTSAGLAILLQHQDVKEALLQAAKSIIADTVGGVMANEISVAYAEENLNWVTHKLAHGALGAFTGTVLGDDPVAGALAGALGGMASEIIADSMMKGAAERAFDTALAQASSEGRPMNPNELQAVISEEMKKVVNIGRIGTALSAFALGQDVNIANRTGTNALENNFIPLVMVGLSVASALYSGYEVYKAYEDAEKRETGTGAEAALKELAKQGVINLAGGAVGKGAALTLKAILAKNPILAIAFNKASHKLDSITDAAVNSKVASKMPTISNQAIGISWGGGIQGQGMPWEDYLATQLRAGSRLPQNFKTFDFYDMGTQVATSAKTLNTQTAAKLADPKQIYYSLKNNIDSTAGFTEHVLAGVKITAHGIKIRQLEVAIPQGTTPLQWEQIQRAIEYGKTKDVIVNITTVK